MSIAILCAAIQSRNVVMFYYTGDSEPGYRTVEPFMIALNETETMVLSAWFLGGTSKSQKGQWWREYFLSGITDLTVLPEHFSGIRPGYNPHPQKFHSVRCAV
jgi:hypothetical protein